MKAGISLLTMALLVGASLAAVNVAADIVTNDVRTGAGLVEVPLGATVTVAYWIVVTNDRGDPTYLPHRCNAGDGTPTTLKVSAPSHVALVEPSDGQRTYTECADGPNLNAQTFTFQAIAVGDAFVTTTILDADPRETWTNQAAFRFVVVDPDTTPPVITPDVQGTLGNNGWYVGDVDVSWAVDDPESGVASSSGCDPSLLAVDSPGVTYTCSAENGEGLASAVDVTVKRDATAPTITPLTTVAGWYNAPVTLDFACDDATSGPLAATVQTVVATEGVGVSGSATCEDMAGNTASGVIGGINLDLTPPDLGLTAPSTVAKVGSPLSYSFHPFDSLSGVVASGCDPDLTPPPPPVHGDDEDDDGDDDEDDEDDGDDDDKKSGGHGGSSSKKGKNKGGDDDDDGKGGSGHGHSWSGHGYGHANHDDDDDDGDDDDGSAPSGPKIAPGPNVVTCWATDAAGNTATATLVITGQYETSGFHYPKASGSTYKLGKYVKVKFSLVGGSVGLPAVAKLYVVKMVNGVESGPVLAAVSDDKKVKDNVFEADSDYEDFEFKMTTKNLSVGTWELRAVLDDGSVLRETIEITKK